MRPYLLLLVIVLEATQLLSNTSHTYAIPASFKDGLHVKQHGALTETAIARCFALSEPCFRQHRNTNECRQFLPWCDSAPNAAAERPSPLQRSPENSVARKCLTQFVVGSCTRSRGESFGTRMLLLSNSSPYLLVSQLAPRELRTLCWFFTRVSALP